MKKTKFISLRELAVEVSSQKINNGIPVTPAMVVANLLGEFVLVPMREIDGSLARWMATVKPELFRSDCGIECIGLMYFSDQIHEPYKNVFENQHGRWCNRTNSTNVCLPVF